MSMEHNEWKLSEKEFEELIERLKANPKNDTVAEVVSHLDIDLPGMPGDELFERAQTQLAHEIAVAHESAYNPWYQDTCEDHYYEVTFSSTSKTAIDELINMNTEANDLLAQNVIQLGNIVERCDHGDVQDCEDCDFKEEA